MKSRLAAARAALGAVVVLAAGALLLRAFSGVDLRGTLHAVKEIGPFVLLALAPWLGGMACDAIGMRILLRTMGRRVGLLRLLPIRIATEALHVTAPAGFLVADSATASLLATRCGVPIAEGAVLAVARKWLVMRAHAAYIVTGAVVGGALLSAVSERYLGGRWLPWALGASALAPLILSLGLGLGFRGRALLARLQRGVAKLPWPALRARAVKWREGASAGDANLSRIGAAREATWSAAGAFFACWLFESLDTAVVLRLLGVSLDFTFALAAEVGISMLRSVGNVMPAGLGVQDAGYATLLPAMGVAPDVAAAFVLVKRGKELVWIAVGYALLAVLRRGEGRANERTPTEALISASPGTPGISVA